MGAIGGLVGLGGGAAGTSFSAPGAAQLMGTTNEQQLGNAYGQTQSSLAAQQQLLSAIQSQNGLGRQADIYNQLQGVAQGTGPNPAQAQYNQNLQNLAQQQAGAISSIKGISPAQQAYMIAQQGGSAMQNNAAAAAANQANQQLGAIGAAGQMASQMAGNQIGQTNANAQAQMAEQGNLFGAAGAANQAAAGMQNSINTANAGMAQTQMQGQQGLIGGVLNGVGSLFAKGGDVEPSMMAEGGVSAIQPSQGPQSKFGKFLKGFGGGMKQPVNAAGSNAAPMTGPGALQAGMSNLIQGIFSKGNSDQQQDNSTQDFANGPVQSAPIDVTGGNVESENLAKGGMIRDFRSGGNVSAVNHKEKAVVKGNSYANDKIPAVLSEGEVVIPRSVMQGQNPADGAARFVQAVLAKRKARGQNV